MPEPRCLELPILGVSLLAVAVMFGGCDAPDTRVVLENDYPGVAARALVVYRAFWQAVAFDVPVLPGATTEARDTVSASANTAYVVLAPGWDPTGGIPPASFVVLQSKNGFDVHLRETLHIPVDDATFAGNCAAGSFLAQEQTDFITERVFAADFAMLHYDPATCTTTDGP